MLHFEPDKESVDRAAELSSRLIRDLRAVSEERSGESARKRFSEKEYDQEVYGAPIIDVVTNVSHMATEFAFIRRMDFKVLCLKVNDSELAPIAMTNFWGSVGSVFGDNPENWFEPWYRGLPYPYIYDIWSDMLQRLKQEDERTILTDVQEAEGAVERSLTRFLSYRFAGIKEYKERPKLPPRSNFVQRLRDWFSGGVGPPDRSPQHPNSSPPGSGGGSGGLHVKVFCQTLGLRLHVSPAYYINWVYFGSPTTPVASYLLPGRYIFAGDGPMMPRRRRDSGVFDIPPTYDPHLTTF